MFLRRLLRIFKGKNRHYDKDTEKTMYYRIAGIFLILTISIILPVVIAHLYAVKIQKNSIIDFDKRFVAREKEIVMSTGAQIYSDAIFLSGIYSREQGQSFDIKANLDKVSRDLKMFTENQGRYRNVSVLDSDGMERAKTVLKENVSSLVSDKDLLNKKDRVYFRKALSMDRGTVYISPIDLDIEGDEVVSPYRPVIKVSSPVYSGTAFSGAVLLNYDMTSLLGEMSRTADLMNGELLIVNASGFFFKASSKKNEWGFLLDGKFEMKFGKDYPAEWEFIKNNESGSLKTQKGVFVFSKVNFLTRTKAESDNLGEYSWVIISRITPSKLSGMLFNLNLTFILLYLFIVSAVVVLTYYIYYIRTKKRKFERALHLKYEFDPLTGAYNRTEFENVIDTEFRKYKNSYRKLSLAVLDIESFSGYNRAYGAVFGDILLEEVCLILKKAFRGEEKIFRWGSDEFLVILPDRSEEEAAESIKKAVDINFGHKLSVDSREVDIKFKVKILNYDPNVPVEENLKNLC